MAKPSRLYLAAILCGLVPLVVGVAVFILWWLTRWPWLMMAGMAVVVNGALAILAGLICLAAYRAHAKASGEPHAGLKSALALAGLVINFPVALAIILAVLATLLPSTLMVVNEGPDLQWLTVSGACSPVEFGAIARGESVTRQIKIERDGLLEFHAERDSQPIVGPLIKDARAGEDVVLFLYIDPNGNWKVREEDD